MGLLERFEDSLDRAVNGAFARAFKAEVQPVEIAAAVQREMDDHASAVDRDRTVAPNAFQVDLSLHDFNRLNRHETELVEELTALIEEASALQGYALVGAPSVALQPDATLDTGIFRVRSDVRPGVSSAVPAVSASGTQPHLLVDDAIFPLSRAVTLIGRATEADLRLEDPGASRNHCEIVLGNPTLVRDLNSTNGTFVNGRRITEEPIEDGGVIRIGATTFTYRSE